jgi:hypothetical protein
MSANSEKAGESLGSVAVLGMLAVAAFGCMQWYALNRDLDSLNARAQVGASPQDMLAYVRSLRDNMVAHDASSGHTALVMKTPANDLALHFQAVNSVIVRLEQIEKLPADSAAYQAGLNDVRGILRELPDVAGGVFWVQCGWWMAILALGCWIAIASA